MWANSKQQRCQMPAAAVVRAATTPSAIAPFETTESGRELGHAEPLMAPWWKLQVVSYCELCIVQAGGHSAARAMCAAQRTVVLPHINAGWQCICEADGGRCGGVEGRARLTPHSATLCRQASLHALDDKRNRAVLAQQQDGLCLCCERP